ncbi:SIR2 family protein [Mesorhizobium sp. YC-39]|uniref:SIR2 family protein n=1 Tax=unclassified Mesorhizobium TaxID=325217 RepID=UPI0021E803A7|nr:MULTISPECIES: SIR2 family protein [unclassified Mesorhizobium]MCV3205567.1 SIR2 family protein [Mesorhizobium sp. YC-2]MCV3228034.1 SIR2 family protein [Mesorhizobium sp. YC-39]
MLDGPLREFSDGVADDRYAVWLGAGVSLGKLPGLKGIAEAVLEHVRSKVEVGNAVCAFRASLNDILALVTLDAAQRAAIDFSTPVETWGPIEQIKQQLVDRYAVMLDQFPATQKVDYLVWNGVKVVERYSDPATTPGPEHLGLAALIMEGVASDCASANWDDLIEKAMRVVDGPNSVVLQVRVVPTDVQQNLRRARLYKFHGCAALAGQNELVYRSRIVGRQSQIDGWAAKAENLVMAAKLLDLAISKGTLMLGLSAQDTNIQDVFVRAAAQLPASFPTHPPAVMVSEDQIGVRQRTLLQNFYRDDYPTQSAAIHIASLVRAYASTLLPALWLHVICAKLLAMIDVGAAHLPAGDRDDLRRGLQRLRDLAGGAATVDNHEVFMQAALSLLGRGIRLFNRGRDRAADEGIYVPWTDVGVTRTLAMPHLDSSGLVELALGLAIIGHGERQGHWTCAVSNPADTKSGAIILNGVAASSQIFFASSAHAAAQMFANGHLNDDDDAVVVHSFGPPERAARHPTRAPGRTGKVQLRELSVSSIKNGAVSLDTLLQRFKAEAAL